MTSQTTLSVYQKAFLWTRTLGLTAFMVILAGVLSRPLQAATDDSTLELNSTTGSSEFAIQNSNAQDVFFVNSAGSVLITSNTVMLGTTFYSNGPILMGNSNGAVTISTNVVAGFVTGNSAVPTAANGANANCTFTAGSTASYGILNDNQTNTGTASAALCTVTVPVAAPHQIVCTLTPQNAFTANIPLADIPFVTGTANTWVLTNNTTGLPTHNSYSWIYNCGGF